MPKTSVPDWDTTALNNSDIDGISLAENVMKAPAVNNAFRAMMAQIKAMFTGSVTFTAAEQSQFRTNIGAGVLGGVCNVLLNPTGLVNQRGYLSGTATTGANKWTIDGWRVVVSGQSLSWSSSDNVKTFTAPAGGVESVIKGAYDLVVPDTYVLNWEGTATATIGGVAVAKGGTVSMSPNADYTLRFTGGTFTKPQLERGSSATTFASRDYAGELAKCRTRLWAVTNPGSGLGLCTISLPSSTTIGFGVLDFPQEMIAPPSLSFEAGNAASLGVLGAGGGTIALSAISLTQTGRKQTTVSVTLATGLTQGSSTYLYLSTSPIVAITAEP